MPVCTRMFPCDDVINNFMHVDGSTLSGSSHICVRMFPYRDAIKNIMLRAPPITIIIIYYSNRMHSICTHNVMFAEHYLSKGY